MDYINFLESFLGAGAGAAIVGFLAKDWLALRIKAAIEKETFIQRSRFDLKRTACLEALEVVDAALSHRTWTKSDDGEDIEVIQQTLDIAVARRAYNQLALTCENPDVVEHYADTLGLRAPGESQALIKGDQIVDLRNEMRKELGFGKTLDFDRNKAWIGNLDGAA